MKAKLLFSGRTILAGNVFVEAVLWRVPQPVRGSAHEFKYRLALVADGACVLRYDNEAGKGDHRHVGTVETPIRFTDVDALRNEFRTDVGKWMDENGRYRASEER